MTYRANDRCNIYQTIALGKWEDITHMNLTLVWSLGVGRSSLIMILAKNWEEVAEYTYHQ